MTDFLSAAWFEALNARLSASAPAPLPPGARPCDVVIEVLDGPDDLPHALTLSVDEDGARVAPGDSLAADTIVRLNYPDAAALASGRLDSASALREGRIKVSGDVNALVPLASWLLAALAH